MGIYTSRVRVNVLTLLLRLPRISIREGDLNKGRLGRRQKYRAGAPAEILSRRNNPDLMVLSCFVQGKSDPLPPVSKRNVREGDPEDAVAASMSRRELSRRRNPMVGVREIMKAEGISVPRAVEITEVGILSGLVKALGKDGCRVLFATIKDNNRRVLLTRLPDDVCVVWINNLEDRVIREFAKRITSRIFRNLSPKKALAFIGKLDGRALKSLFQQVSGDPSSFIEAVTAAEDSFRLLIAAIQGHRGLLWKLFQVLRDLRKSECLSCLIKATDAQTLGSVFSQSTMLNLSGFDENIQLALIDKLPPDQLAAVIGPLAFFHLGEDAKRAVILKLSEDGIRSLIDRAHRAGHGTPRHKAFMALVEELRPAILGWCDNKKRRPSV